MTHTPKQHWELGAGTGKSFIIAAIAALYLVQNANARIQMIVPSNYLLRRDRARFEALWSTVGQDRISYHVNMTNCSEDTTLTIIDEADELMLMCPGMFFGNLAKRQSVLMFSGSFRDSNDAFLPKIFKHFRITAWDCTFVQDSIRAPTFNEYLAADELNCYIAA